MDKTAYTHTHTHTHIYIYTKRITRRAKVTAKAGKTKREKFR